MSLFEIKKNEKACIITVCTEESLKRRLYDLGFFPGNFVECILISPFSSPILYKVNGAFIALRSSDAKRIEVAYED